MSKDVDVELSGARQQVMAAMLLNGDTQRQIATAMKLSVQRVSQIVNSESFIQILKETTDRKVSKLLYRWRERLEAAEPAAWKAFMYNLEHRKDLNAVRLYLEQLGFNNKPEKAEHPTGLTIVFPGDAKPPEKVIEVKDENK